MSKRCKDGKRRSYWLYFLNNVLIFKQKIPFDTNYERGWEHIVSRYNIYLLNNNIHQERHKGWAGIEGNNIRAVKFPVSKEKLQALNVPKDLKIEISND